MIALVPLIVLALPVFLLAGTVPIYTDEIVWKILQARYFLDHGLVTNAFPQCGPSFLLTPPVTHLPARIIDAALYQDLSQPLKLRVIGLLGAGALGMLFYALVRAVVRPVPRSTTAASVILSFWGLGVMPFLTALNRPELPILLVLAVLILGAVTTRAGDTVRPLRHDALRLPIYLLIVLILFGTHPKTLLFLPVLVMAGRFWLVSRTSRVIACVVLSIAAAQTVAFTTQRYACPNDETTAYNLAQVTLQLRDAWAQPEVFAQQAAKNVRSIPSYFGHLVLRGTYMAGWLPDHLRVRYLDDAGDLMILVAIGIVYLGVLAALVRALWRPREWWHSPARALFLALVPSLLVLVVYQSHKNAYDGAFLVVLGGLALMLGWPGEDARRWHRLAPVAFAFLVLTTLLSESRMLHHFGPWATGEWLVGGNLAGPSEGTISGFHYGRVNQRVRMAAEACGIDVAQRPKLVVVDDVTYPALGGVTYPLHTMGIWWWGLGIPDHYDFLKTLGSEGVVARCRSLPPVLQERAYEQGDLCCLPTFVGEVGPRFQGES